ncbi:MAG: hypothetical protein ACPK85_01495 [Methanosarcina sp.]
MKNRGKLYPAVLASAIAIFVLILASSIVLADTAKCQSKVTKVRGRKHETDKICLP